jgi:anti-anti-sigma factor
MGSVDDHARDDWQDHRSEQCGRRLRLRTQRMSPALLVVEAYGDIDLAGSDEFAACVCGAAATLRPGERLLVDLSGVTFLAACGVRGLLESDRTATGQGATLRLVITSEPVRMPLRVLGLLEHLAVFACRAQAAA